MIKERWVAACRPVDPTHSRTQCNSPGNGSECNAYDFVFLDIISCNFVLIFFWLHFQPTTFLLPTLSFSFPYFSPPVPLFLAGTNSLLAALLPHSTLNARQNQEFSPGRWTVLSSTRTVNYNQATRCHSPKYGNVPTPRLLHGRLT